MGFVEQPRLHRVCKKEDIPWHWHYARLARKDWKALYVPLFLKVREQNKLIIQTGEQEHLIFQS